MKSEKQQKLIGIVGGLGPYAGLDLLRRLFEQTIAASDQQHLPVALLSLPNLVADRTAFLLGKTQINPAHAIADIVSSLAALGATVIGIPCNTVHAPEIFKIIEKRVQRHAGVTLLNMIDEVAVFLRQALPGVACVGVLSTTGTRATALYPRCLEAQNIEVKQVDKATQERWVQPAIYDPEFGVKAKAEPVTKRARANLEQAAQTLLQQGAEALILGCTELPLAIREKKLQGVPVIDPTLVLARALIREFAPQALKRPEPPNSA